LRLCVQPQKPFASLRLCVQPQKPFAPFAVKKIRIIQISGFKFSTNQNAHSSETGACMHAYNFSKNVHL
jgi:hypothetical protein